MKRKTEIYKVIFEKRKVTVKVIYNKKGYIRLRFSKIDQVTISTFQKMTPQFLAIIMKDNKDIILNAWEKLKKNQSDLKPGEALLLGKVVNINEIDYDKEYNNVIKLIESLYFECMEKYNFQKAELKFVFIKRAWGYCYVRDNKIELNTQIVLLPIHLIKYVIIHEFCHFYVPNHGKDFYEMMSNYIPDYRKQRKELGDYSKYLNRE